MKKDVSANSRLLQTYPNIPHIRHNFFHSLKQYNKAKKRKARTYKENILQQLDELKDTNPESYWKLLKCLRNEDTDKTGANISLKEWELYFKYLNTDKFHSRNYEITKRLQILENEVTFNETDFRITTVEISNCLKKIRNKKSPGLDRILPEMLKYSQHIMLPVLEKVFNYVL